MLTTHHELDKGTATKKEKHNKNMLQQKRRE